MGAGDCLVVHRRRSPPTIRYRSATIRARTLKFLADYTPRALPAQDWIKVREFAVDSVANVEVRDERHAKNLALIAGRFGLWALALGYELDPEVVLHPAMVQRYLREETWPTEQVERDLRSRLRRIGECSTRHAPWPARDRPLPRGPGNYPYSSRELRLLEADGRVQRTDHRVRMFGIILVNGLGWAAAAPDLRVVRGTDFVRKRKVLVARVNGREVPVRVDYADRVLEYAKEAGGDYVIGGEPHASKVSNQIARFTYGAETPKLILTRLRSTWVRDLLVRGVPPTELRRALGLSTYSFLRDVLPEVPLLSESEHRLLLAGVRRR